MIATMATTGANAVENKDFNFHVDRFADIEVLRYEVPEYSRLSLDQKKMLYYLSQAAQMGRDIIWDQNGRYNLQIRQLLEKIYTKYDGDRNSKDFKAFEKYLKQVWFGNGSDVTSSSRNSHRLSSRSRLANSAIAVYRCNRGRIASR